ncbi:hypothetical protein GTCCBUS3UF5_16860 [Geobacillus thermoleovorans CCB_US3_UF5]|uniref:Transposase n=1 Tax=Geobacillus thermoleovorans CCB_US3_UF5 TaxID=1111068 RepID=A0ABN4A041_GEOTH|nr:hypothetical protein GTCCBUS3UF5_16860 [Geobacillus thermoleovorans CCB_US3_UF5]
MNDSTFVWNIQWLHLHFVLGCALYKREVGELQLGNHNTDGERKNGCLLVR